MSKDLLKPGSIVTCRSDIDQLTIWKSYRSKIEHHSDTVSINEILIILKAKSPSKKELDDEANMLTDEWKIGAYQVLTPRGLRGWIGAGWVTPITI